MNTIQDATCKWSKSVYLFLERTTNSIIIILYLDGSRRTNKTKTICMDTVDTTRCIWEKIVICVNQPFKVAAATIWSTTSQSKTWTLTLIPRWTDPVLFTSSKYLPLFDMQVKLLNNVDEKHISIRKWLTWPRVSAVEAGVCMCVWCNRLPRWMLMYANTARSVNPWKWPTHPVVWADNNKAAGGLWLFPTNVFAKVWLEASGKRQNWQTAPHQYPN